MRISGGGSPCVSQATQDEMAKAKEIEQMFNKPEKQLRTPREIRPPYRDHNHAQMSAPNV